MHGATPRPVSRRTVSRAAWTVPALAILPTARAAAASSPCSSLPSVAFQGDWANPNIYGFTSNGWAGFSAGRFGGNRDPALGTGAAGVETSITLQLEPNQTYRFSVSVLTWLRTNPLTAGLALQTPDRTTYRNTDEANPGTISHEFTAPASGTVTLKMTLGIVRSRTSTVGDDLVVGSPTLTCV